MEIIDEVDALLEATRKLVEQAEKNLSEISAHRLPDKVGVLTSLAERCNEIRRLLRCNKVQLLGKLLKLSVAIGVSRYEDIDEKQNHYCIPDGVKDESGRCKITYSGRIGNSATIEGFVNLSEKGNKYGLDFGALCKAILNAALEFLKTVPPERMKESEEVREFFAELAPLVGSAASQPTTPATTRTPKKGK